MADHVDFHTTDGGPTAGRVAIDDAKPVQVIQWLKPGAVMAIAQQPNRFRAAVAATVVPSSGEGLGVVTAG